MRIVPQNISWNQISGGLEFYSKLQCLNELLQLLRSSLHVQGFELSEHSLRWSPPVTKSIRAVLLPTLIQFLKEQEVTMKVKQLQYSYSFIYCFTLNNAALCVEIQSFFSKSYGKGTPILKDIFHSEWESISKI